MTDIVERLQKWVDELDVAKAQIKWELPDGTLMVDCLRDAIAQIKRCRSLAGKADVGPSFADIAKDLPRRSTEPPDPK